MNKKQLNIMWLGIAVVVGFAILALLEGQSGVPALAVNSVLIFLAVETIVIVVTIGLIITFADRKPKD
jgi:hypothetical protein